MLRPVRAVATPTLERAIDGLLASELPEALAHSLVEHRVVRRMAVEALEHADVEGAITSALESERAERIVRELLASPAVERMLKSPEFERVLGQILASPQVRRALAQQSTSLAAESAAGARRGAVRLDDVVERRPRRWLGRTPRVTPTPYAGVATRGLALAVDAVIVTLVFLTGTAFVALVTSLVGALRPVWLAETLAGISWLLLQIAYFAGFWSTAGQTPGMRVMRVRVLDRANGRPSFGRSVARLAWLFLAIVPCFAGLLPAFVDDRRRALHDFIAGTVVVYANGHPKGMTSPSLACPSVAATRESGRSEPSPL
jgi:uncharacterized RDD family membrane protein YckC